MAPLAFFPRVAALAACFATSTAAETYAELPLIGQIGTDVTPEYVEDVLQHAVASGVEHVVLRIDTRGGFVPPAERIAAALRDFEDRLTYHAVIERCVSAGVWMAFASDTVHMTPDAIWGAAAVHDTLADGSTRHNEKSSSIFAAEIAAIAARHGQSIAVVRAMITPGAELWSWRDAAGQHRLSAHRPDPGEHAELVKLDGDSTLLTLTAQEAIDAGIARAFDGDLATFGAALGFEAWTRLDGYGLHRSVQARYRRNLDEFVAFNNNLRQDPNLLSWRDARHNTTVPSLFGTPRPGLDRAVAERALASFIERLEAAFRRTGSEPGPSRRRPGAAPQTDHDAARAAWLAVDQTVAEIEAQYLELTGIPAELGSLRTWPLAELQASWAAEPVNRR